MNIRESSFFFPSVPICSCRFLQCFDLSNFLNANCRVSGQRWRCLVCEDNITCDELQICALTEALISEFRKEIEPTERDRIEFCSDKSYKLLGNRKKRYNKKRSRDGSSKTATTAKEEVSVEAEVIDLDHEVIELD